MRCLRSTITKSELEMISDSITEATDLIDDPAEQSETSADTNDDHPATVGDLMILAEEVTAFVERKLAEIPVPQVEFNTKLDALESKLDAVLAIVNAQPKTDTLLAAIGKLTDAM